MFLILMGVYGLTLAVGRVSLGRDGTIVLLGLKMIITLGMVIVLTTWFFRKDVQLPSAATDATEPEGAEPPLPG